MKLNIKYINFLNPTSLTFSSTISQEESNILLDLTKRFSLIIKTNTHIKFNKVYYISL